jgi:hypothetical protein
VNEIPAEEAFRILVQWNERGVAIEVLMSQGRRNAAVAALNRVLPHSQKALLTLRDESGEVVPVTVSLEGATWERGDADAVLAATFANGYHYVFGESPTRPSQS